jgi:hypothetical protein
MRMLINVQLGSEYPARRGRRSRSNAGGSKVQKYLARLVYSAPLGGKYLACPIGECRSVGQVMEVGCLHRAAEIHK